MLSKRPGLLEMSFQSASPVPWSPISLARFRRKATARRQGDMASATTSAEPFGTYRLPAPLEALRRQGNALPDTFAGRRLASLIRKGCLLLGGDGPFDIPVFDGQRARVWPRSNRCEKRAFSGLRSWDRIEREFLADLVGNAPVGQPFSFVDAGANVGFYSLFVVDAATARGREARVLAIEPDPINGARLAFNIAASERTDIRVCSDALGGSERTAVLVDNTGNRGEVHLGRDGEAGERGVTVRVRPMLDILNEAGIDRIDALKLDIEGVEFETLSAFFASADFRLWPRHILLEVGRSGTTEAYEHCRRLGYEPVLTARINTILRRPAEQPVAADA